MANLFTPSMDAQTIRVRLLDAGSGKPMKDKNVTVVWDNVFPKTIVKVDNNGSATVNVPLGATSFLLNEGPKLGKEPYRIAYYVCNGSPNTYISLHEVVNTGVVPANVCGKRKIPPHPGEVVFWAEPLHWWVLDMQ